MTSFLDHVFVIHVSEGYEERRQHIDKHLPERGIVHFEYMLRGDIKDLTPEVKTKYFKGNDNLPCLLYTSPSPRDRQKSRMPSSA